MVVIVACSSPSGDESGDSVVPSTATTPAPDVIEDARATADLAAVCVDDAPVEIAQLGTVNTIVVPPDADAFDGSVRMEPTAACPGDTVTFVVSIVNVSDETRAFSAGRGLIFSSGGPAKWSLARLDDLTVEVPPGDRLEQVVTGTIPAVAPGTYRVGPEGSGFFGEMTVLDPTDR